MSLRKKSFLLASLALTALPLSGWESSLYDESWSPVPAIDFYTDKVIQDFSYAGYHRGERPIPDPAGPVFDVVADYQADPTGATDSTAKIQSAIDAAEAAGGGVVYLPAGTFAVKPGEGDSFALRINASSVVMRGAGRGQTFLLCTSYEMRSKKVIEVVGNTPYWGWNSGTAYSITEDLPGPVLEIPVADVSPFSVGDWILIRTDVTAAWVNEHKEPLWLGFESSMSGLRYSRQILEIDEARNRLVIDAPTRYAIKTRDNARVYIRNNGVSEVGLEDFSIGCVQHPGDDWGESDYSNDTKSAYDTHASYLISWRNARNSWVRRVDTFQAAGNTSGAHLLSNGLLLTECRGMTVEDCHFQRPQYGGGGGNGYMFRLSNSNECLVRQCTAEFSRHGIVFSHMGSSGNVIHDCLDKNTGKATGSNGSYNTSGKASDHHMRFSHSNLIDVCTVQQSWFTAHYRPYGSDPKHNLTSAHTVFWNLLGHSSPIGKVVHSQQSRYGYVVGTRGAVTAVETGGVSTEKTDPVDHVEGVGSGDSLDPYSLYLDQFRRRIGFPRVDLGDELSFYFPVNSIELPGVIEWGETAVIPDQGVIAWSQTGGPGGVVFDSTSSLNPRVAFPGPGEYEFTCIASLEGYDNPLAESTDTVMIRVFGPGFSTHRLNPAADGYVWGNPANQNQGYSTSTTLWMKNVSGTDYDREFYLQFDLSGWGSDSVEEAELTLHATLPDTDSTAEMFFSSSDSWDETNLSWATRPPFTESLSVWSPDASQVQQWDLKTRSSTEASGDGLLTLGFRIQSQQTSATIFRYASRENPDPELRPSLEVLLKQTDLPTYSDWIDGYPSLSSGEKDPDDDPEEDDLPNLAELFHELLPDQISVSPYVAGSDEYGPYFRFPVSVNVPEDGWLIVETTDDVGSSPWSQDPEIPFEQEEGTGEILLRLPDRIVSSETSGVQLVYSMGNERVAVPIPLRAGAVSFAVQRNAGGEVNLSWSDAGASFYEVFRGTTPDFVGAKHLGNVAGLNYVDEEMDPAADAFYWVRAVSAAGIAGLVDAPFLLEAMEPRPDLMVGSSLSAMSGDNQYGLTSLGARKIRVKKRKTLRFYFASESDELPEEMTIVGTKGHRSARFSYSRLAASRENVTAAIWLGRLRTNVLSGGGRERFEMQLKLKNPKRKRASGYARGRSVHDPSVSDAIQAGVRISPRR